MSDLPLSPHAKKILDRAQRFARGVNYRYISADCLLIAMLLEEGLHLQILKDFGVTETQVDRVIAHILRADYKKGLDGQSAQINVAATPDEQTSTSNH